MYHPNFKLPLFICSDGSKRGIGGYLFQNVDGEERVISYFSRATTKDERKWDTRELEVLALIATLEYFRHYIEGQKLFLQTDHRNLTWLARMKGRSAGDVPRGGAQLPLLRVSLGAGTTRPGACLLSSLDPK